MKHRHQRRSDCPINFALETFGDLWSLLLIRDIVYFGKRTYGEFFASEEGMATNILASRLARLEEEGDLMIQAHQEHSQQRVSRSGNDFLVLSIALHYLNHQM